MNIKGWTWRVIIIIELVILAKIAKSQTMYTLDVDYTRIPVNNYDVPVTDTLRTVFVIYDKNIGIVTLYDTLALIYQTKDGDFYLFVDCYHNGDQEYALEKHMHKDRFLWILSPIRPFNERKLYSLILESL